MHDRPVVTAAVTMRNAYDLPVPSTWHYYRCDPLAVTVEFGTLPDHLVAWTFARDLLIAGLYAPAGVGDVQVFPAKGRLAVRLASGDGTETVTCRAVDMAAFVGRTLAWVPAGGEATRLDVSGAISRILAEAGAS